ncbi:HVO_A0114 family putative DNA-binding protein [Duganella sp. PWIR1]
MKTIRFEIRSIEEAFEDTIRTLESGLPAQSAVFTFTTPELLWQVMNAERWEILKHLCRTGPLKVKDLASLLGIDFNTVYNDVEALLVAGLVDRKEGGHISFPYKEIKVDFLFKAA